MLPLIYLWCHKPDFSRKKRLHVQEKSGCLIHCKHDSCRMKRADSMMSSARWTFLPYLPWVTVSPSWNTFPFVFLILSFPVFLPVWHSVSTSCAHSSFPQSETSQETGVFSRFSTSFIFSTKDHDVIYHTKLNHLENTGLINQTVNTKNNQTKRQKTLCFVVGTPPTDPRCGHLSLQILDPLSLINLALLFGFKNASRL